MTTLGGLIAVYQFDFGPVIAALPRLFNGLMVTVLVTLATFIMGVGIGGVATAARLSPIRLISLIAHVYVDIFRATPILIQIFIIAIAFAPAFGIRIDIFITGGFALALNVGAFLSEIWRGAIQSIDRGQREAAVSTGMSERQAMRRVVVPQALRRSVPLVAAMWISLFKDTALLAFVGVRELYLEGQLEYLDSFRQVETMTVIVLFYFVLTYPQSLLIERLFQKYRVRD